MATSDSIQFKVGDRVRDRQTGEVGRVLNVVAIGGDMIALTIAIFAGSKIAKRLGYTFKRGQFGGLQWERTTPAIHGRTEVVDAEQATATSARSAEAAERNASTAAAGRRQAPVPTQTATEIVDGAADDALHNALSAEYEAHTQARAHREKLHKRRVKLKTSSGSAAFDLLDAPGLVAPQDQAERALAHAEAEVNKLLGPISSEQAAAGHEAVRQMRISGRVDPIPREPGTPPIRIGARDVQTTLTGNESEALRLALNEKVGHKNLEQLYRMQNPFKQMAAFIADPGTYSSATGEWSGGFVGDVMIGGAFSPHEQTLHQLLRRADIPQSVARNLPREVGNGSQLLFYVQRHLRTLSKAEAHRQWREVYHPIFRRLLLSGNPRYQAIEKKINALNRKLDINRATSVAFNQDNASWNEVALENSQFGSGVQHQFDLWNVSDTKDFLYSVSPEIDFDDIVYRQRRLGQVAYARNTGTPLHTRSMASLGKMYEPADLLKPGILGKTIRHRNGIYYQVTGFNTFQQTLTLAPIHHESDLYLPANLRGLKELNALHRVNLGLPELLEEAMEGTSVTRPSTIKVARGLRGAGKQELPMGIALQIFTPLDPDMISEGSNTYIHRIQGNIDKDLAQHLGFRGRIDASNYIDDIRRGFGTELSSAVESLLHSQGWDLQGMGLLKEDLLRVAHTRVLDFISRTGEATSIDALSRHAITSALQDRHGLLEEARRYQISINQIDMEHAAQKISGTEREAFKSLDDEGVYDRVVEAGDESYRGGSFGELIEQAIAGEEGTYSDVISPAEFRAHLRKLGEDRRAGIDLSTALDRLQGIGSNTQVDERRLNALEDYFRYDDARRAGIDPDAIIRKINRAIFGADDLTDPMGQIVYRVKSVAGVQASQSQMEAKLRAFYLSSGGKGVEQRTAQFIRTFGLSGKIDPQQVTSLLAEIEGDLGTDRTLLWRQLSAESRQVTIRNTLDQILGHNASLESRIREFIRRFGGGVDISAKDIAEIIQQYERVQVVPSLGELAGAMGFKLQDRLFSNINEVIADATSVSGGVSFYRLRPEQFGQISEALEQVIDVAERTRFQGPLPEGLQWAPTEQGLGIKIFSGKSADSPYYTYHRGGVLTHPDGFTRQMIMGDTSPITVPVTDLLSSSIEGVKPNAALLHERVVEHATKPEMTGLFRHGEHTIGLQSSVADVETLRTNYLKMLKDPVHKITLLDIETVPETGEIINIGAQRYVKEHSNLRRITGTLDIATENIENAFQQMYDSATENLTAAQKAKISVPKVVRDGDKMRITKNGYTVTINNVVQNEQELIRQSAQFLKEEIQSVGGHNISFDFKNFIKRAEFHGLNEEAAFFREVASKNLIETMLGAQAAQPGLKSYSLEALYQRLKGFIREIHLGKPDVAMNAVVLQDQIRHSSVITAALEQMEPITIDPNKVLWDRVHKKAYRFTGTVDPDAAGEIKKGLTGTFEDGFHGLVAEQIDFQTGQPTGKPQVIFQTATPHGMAHRFNAEFTQETPEAAQELMESRVKDLARRRVRRVTTDPGAFGKLLVDQERYKLAMAAAQGEEARQAALMEIMQRRMAALERGPAGEWESKVLQGVLSWDKYLNDSQVLASVVQAGGFIENELPMHQRVVDWLEHQVAAADSTNRGMIIKEANQVWLRYMEQVAQFHPWQEMAPFIVPEADRQVSMMVPILGKNPIALRVGTEEAAAESLNRLHSRILDKLMGGSRKSIQGFLDAGNGDLGKVLSWGNRYYDATLEHPIGSELRQHIWDRYIQPALAKEQFQSGGVDFALQMKNSVKTAADAARELHLQGSIAAQRAVEHATDPLVPRALEGSKELEALQDALTSRSLTEVAAAHQQFQFTAWHPAVPHTPEWLGRTPDEIFDALAGKTEEEVAQARYVFRRVLRESEGRDYARLSEAVRRRRPEWLENLHPSDWHSPSPLLSSEAVTLAATPETTQAAGKVFNPGKLNQIGLEIGEKIEANQALLKKIGIYGGLAVAGIALAQGLFRPKGPEPREQPDVEASSEAEVQRRNQREVAVDMQPQRVSVRVSGHDMTAADPNEIVQSIHAALGGLMGDDPEHRIQVHDRRQKIDSRYIDQLAERVLNRRF